MEFVHFKVQNKHKIKEKETSHIILENNEISVMHSFFVLFARLVKKFCSVFIQKKVATMTLKNYC